MLRCEGALVCSGERRSRGRPALLVIRHFGANPILWSYRLGGRVQFAWLSIHIGSGAGTTPAEGRIQGPPIVALRSLFWVELVPFSEIVVLQVLPVGRK